MRPAGIWAACLEVCTRSLQNQLQLPILVSLLHKLHADPQYSPAHSRIKTDENNLLTHPKKRTKVAACWEGGRRELFRSSPVTEAVTPAQQDTVMFQLTDLQSEEWVGKNIAVGCLRGKGFLYLISAPAPKSQHGEAKYKSRPRNVTCDWVPEQMEGIRTWEVTGRVWDYDLWNRCAVFLLQAFIPANFFKSWKENTNDLMLFPYLSLTIAFLFTYLPLISFLFIPPSLLEVKVCTGVSWILPRVLVVWTAHPGRGSMQENLCHPNPHSVLSI